MTLLETATLAQRERVLVVEDVPETLELVKLFLKDAPFDVDYAEGSQEAIKLYLVAKESGRPYALIVTDVMMVKMTGIAFGEFVRGTGDFRTPIRYLTGAGPTLTAKLNPNHIWVKPEGTLRIRQLIEGELARLALVPKSAAKISATKRG